MPHNGGKLTPNLDQGGTKVLNLTVLQRIDPSVEDILITASHVTLYDFNIDLNQWVLISYCIYVFKSSIHCSQSIDLI